MTKYLKKDDYHDKVVTKEIFKDLRENSTAPLYELLLAQRRIRYEERLILYARIYPGQEKAGGRYLIESSFLTENLRDLARLFTFNAELNDLPVTNLLVEHTWFGRYHYLLLLYREFAYPIMAYLCFYRIFPLLRLFIRVRIFSFIPFLILLPLFYMVTVMTLQVYHLILDNKAGGIYVGLWLLIFYQSSALFINFIIIVNCLTNVVICFFERKNLVTALILLQFSLLFLSILCGTFFFPVAFKLAIFVGRDLVHQLAFSYFMKYITAVYGLIIMFQCVRALISLSAYKRLTILEHTVRANVLTMLDEIGLYYRNYMKFSTIYFDYFDEPEQITINKVYFNFDYKFTLLNDDLLNTDPDPFKNEEEDRYVRYLFFSIIERVAYSQLQLLHDMKKSLFDVLVMLYALITAGTFRIPLPDFFEIVRTFYVHPWAETLLEKFDLDDRFDLDSLRQSKILSFYAYLPPEFPAKLKLVEVAPHLQFVNIFFSRDEIPLDCGIFSIPKRRSDFRSVREIAHDYLLLKTYYLLLVINVRRSDIELLLLVSEVENLLYSYRLLFLFFVYYFLLIAWYKILVLCFFFIFVPELLISYKLFNHLVIRRNLDSLGALYPLIFFFCGFLHFLILLYFIRKGPIVHFDWYCYKYLFIYVLFFPIIFYSLFYRLNNDICNLRHKLRHTIEIPTGTTLYFQLVFVMFTAPALFSCLLLLDIPPAFHFGNFLAHALFDCPLLTWDINLLRRYYRVLNIPPLFLFGISKFDDKYLIIFYLLVILIIFLCSVFISHFYYHWRHANECFFLVRVRLYSAYLHQFSRVNRVTAYHYNTLVKLRLENPRKVSEAMPFDETKVVNPTEVKNFYSSGKRAFLEEVSKPVQSNK